MATQDTQGVRLVAVERDRQMSVEGWTPEHDDAHANGELLQAANCYAIAGLYLEKPDHAGEMVGLAPDLRFPPNNWPWDASWWKPDFNDPKRNLVKAAALIVAEIDRLLRKSFGLLGEIVLVIEPDPTLPFSIWPNTGSVILQQEEDGTYAVSQTGGSRFTGFATEEAALAGAKVAWPQIESFEKPPLASATIKVAVTR